MNRGGAPSAWPSRVSHRWGNRPAYLAAVAAGGMRRHLDDTEAGVPDGAERAVAAETPRRRTPRRAGIEWGAKTPGAAPPSPNHRGDGERGDPLPGAD